MRASPLRAAAGAGIVVFFSEELSTNNVYFTRVYTPGA